MNSRDGGTGRQAGRVRGCAVGRCGESPQYLSAYRYSRKSGRAVTVSRALCAKHARLFSMKYTLAWPSMLRRARRSMTALWAQLAA
ncbi:MAG: hypothetical protein ABUL77_04720 [Bacteroidota bacterium]